MESEISHSKRAVIHYSNRSEPTGPYCTFMERHDEANSMAEDSRDKSERRLRLDQMPLAVKRLVDTMIGIDPNFEIEDWLIQKANEDLALIELDIDRERKQLEQRIHRLESLAKRLAPEDIREVIYDVLRHRIGLTYEAEAENVTTQDVISKIVNSVEVP